MMKILALAISAVERHLEEAVSETLLYELLEVHVVDVYVDRLDEVPNVGLLAELEVSLPIFQEVDVVVHHPIDPTPAPEGATTPQGCGGGVFPRCLDGGLGWVVVALG
jgi:hypothetical protein